MATCPDGHESTATDFCDVCGMRIGGTAAASSPAAASGAVSGSASGTATLAEPAAGETAAAPAEAIQTCPNCGAERTGQFCESCGMNFTSGMQAPAQPATPVTAAPPAPAGEEKDPAAESMPSGSSATAEAQAAAATTTGNWNAVVTADHDYYERVVAAGGPEAGTIQFPAYCPQRQFRLTGPEMRIGRRSASRGIEPEIDLTGPPMDTGVSHLHAVLIEEPDGTWSVLDPGSSNGTQLNGTEMATGVKMPLHDGDTIGLGGWTVITIRAN